MEINQMRYFRAIVQYGSFSEAAEHLHITQPALSKSIAKLEAELGAPLFERRGSHITLTPSGRVILPYCGNVLNTVESGINAFQESIGLKKGHLTIAISTEIFIKHLILRFLQQYPEVSFTCHLMSPDEMARALEEGIVDFALSDEPIVGDRIDWHPIYRGHLTAVLNEHDPLLKQDSIAMEALRNHQFCIGHLRTNLYSAIYQLCNEAGFQPKIRYLGYDPDMAGILLSLPNSVIISPSSINHSIRLTEIDNASAPAIRIRGTEGRAIVGIGIRVGHYQSEAALAFYDMILNYYQSIDGPLCQDKKTER